MSQLKRFNGTNWETVGGSLAPKTTTTNSDTDTYSCNYINGKTDKNIVSIYISANTDVSNNGKVPFDLSTSVGSKLTFDNTNKEIIIGDGVTKVKVDLTLGVRYTATNNQHYGMILTINGNEPTDAQYVLEARCQKTLGQVITVGSGAKLIPVTSGDKLSCKIIAGATCPCTPATFLTVEVVE